MSFDKNSSVASLVATACDSQDATERQDVYGFLSTRLREASDGALPAIIKELSLHRLEPAMYRDVAGDDVALAQAALQTLGLCLFIQSISSSMTAETAINLMCDVIVKTSDKTSCTRALWCIAKQTLPENAIQKQLGQILEAIEHGQCKKNFQSLTVEHEALCAIVRLLEQVGDDMEPHAPRWGKLVYPLLLHDAPKIRHQALIAMEKGMPAMVRHRDDIIRVLLPDLKSLLISQMSKLMNNKLELHVLKVWGMYITLLGKAIHHGGLINSLLPIVEQGFKNSSPEVKVASYQAWQTLIDNFALNKDILGDQKRIRLLMQVFRINNAKHEQVAVEKLHVWWHFVIKLQEGTAAYFEQVVVPLLHYALSGVTNPASFTPGKPANKGPAGLKPGVFKSPATPQLSVSGLSGTPQTFLAVQHKGCEILSHVLGKGDCNPDNPRPVYTMADPEHDIIPGAVFFIKHAASIIGAVSLCLDTLGDQIEESLLHHIWFCLRSHIKSVLGTAQKTDAVDVLQIFLQSFQGIVESQSLAPEKILKLLEALVSSTDKDKGIPQTILSSASYSTGGSGKVMQGNPAFFLMGTLFHHRMLETSSSHPLFCRLFDKLVDCQLQHEAGALSSMQQVAELLESVASQVESRDSLAKLWLAVTNPLLKLILKTNEVNQGLNLEHDFSCLLITLLVPVENIFGEDLSMVMQTSVLKTWSKLYTAFARCAALINGVPANTACEELAAKILHASTETRLMEEVYLSSVSQILACILETVEFSGLTDTGQFGFKLSLSPSKFGRKKLHPLQNLHSFVALTDRLLEAIVQTDVSDVDLWSPDTKKSKTSAVSSAITHMIQTLTTLFTHLPTSSMVVALVVRVGASLGKLYTLAGKKNRSCMTQAILQKLDRLWQDIVTALQSRYSGMYDSDFLYQVSHLLEATFLHPRQKIRSQTTMFWNATFAHAAPLTYPDSLKPVLAKVKEKVAILLPGWDSKEILSIDETPNSCMSQGESQVPLPSIVGMVSPRKAPGSFLNRVVPPAVEMSPLKPTHSPGKPSKSPIKATEKPRTKLRLNVNDFNDDDFVVIQSSPRKKQVLTNHQKDVLRERSTIPALYSNIDASQDITLMSKLGISDVSQMSQSMSCTPTPTPITEITPFPFFKGTKEKISSDDSVVKSVPSKDKPTDREQDTVSPNSKSAKNRKRRSVRFASKIADSTEKENISDKESPEEETSDSKKDEEKMEITVPNSANSEKNSTNNQEEDMDLSEESASLLTEKQQTSKSEKKKVEKPKSTIFENNGIISDSDCSENSKGKTKKIEIPKSTHIECNGIISDSESSENSGKKPTKGFQPKIDDILSPDSQFLSLSQNSKEVLVVKEPRALEKQRSDSPRRSKRSISRIDLEAQKTDSPSKTRKTRLSEVLSKEPPKESPQKAKTAKEVTESAPKTRLTRRNSLLDMVTEESQAPKDPEPKTSNLPILAEETQQMSQPPSKPEHSVEESQCVEETPAKDFPEAEPKDNSDCTKKLFKCPDPVPDANNKIVPYSETQSESETGYTLSESETGSVPQSPDLVPSSQSPDYVPSSQSPVQKPDTGALITPPRTTPELSMLTLSPVVQIERLAINTYSQQTNKYTKLKETTKEDDTSDSADNSGRPRRTRRRASGVVKEEKTDNYEWGDNQSKFENSGLPSTRRQTSTDRKNSQEVQDKSKSVNTSEKEKISTSSEVDLFEASDKVLSQCDMLLTQTKEFLADKTVSQTVTETNKDNVFIVEVVNNEKNKSKSQDLMNDTTQDMEIDLTETQPIDKLDNVKSKAIRDNEIDLIDTQQIDKPTDSKSKEKSQETQSKEDDNTIESETKSSDSQVGLNPEIEPMNCDSVEQSLTPDALKLKDSAQNTEDEIPCSQNSTSGTRKLRGRRRKSTQSDKTSQSSVSSSVENASINAEPSFTPVFEPWKQGTMACESQSEMDIFDQVDSESTKVNVDQTETETKSDSKEVSTKSGSSQLDNSQMNSIKTQETEKSQTVSKPMSPAKTGESSDTDDNVPLKFLSQNNSQDNVSSNSQENVSSQESEGFQVSIQDADQPLADKNEQEHTNPSDSSDDDEPLSQVRSSTPARLPKRKGKRKTSPGNKLDKKLSIDMMHSPITKVLRSSGVKRLSRNRILNKSVDSVKRMGDRRKRNKGRKKIIITQDDLELGAQAQENRRKSETDVDGTLAECDKNNIESDREMAESECECSDASVMSENFTSKEPDSAPEEVHNEPGRDQENTQDEPVTSNIMDSLQKSSAGTLKSGNFVCPLRSPPRRGKLFSTHPETPPSHKKPLLSRASMILQRAKMVKAVASPISRGRGPISALPGAAERRPGILKSPVSQDSPTRLAGVGRGAVAQKLSPPSVGFRTINLPRIYSPSASPSAGILRKRKLSGDMPVDSPSPPNKRRVCFNDLIETREIPSAQKEKPPKSSSSRIVGRGSPKPVNRCLDLPSGQRDRSLPPSPLVNDASTRFSTMQKLITQLPKGRVLNMKDLANEVGESELSETQGSIQTTPVSQLDTEKAICPDLVESSIPIEQVLPQLTSSMWSSGLGQLVRSMNIKTVGHLSALTEQEVHTLPIKSPKVETVRSVLQALAAQQDPTKSGDDSQATELDENPLPPRKITLDLLDDPNISSESSEVCEDEPHDLLDEIRRLGNDKKSTPPSSPIKQPEQRPDVSMVTAVEDLIGHFTMDMLQGLPSNQLLQIYTNINEMTTKLNSIKDNVVLALKDKCSTSPNKSQS